MLWLELVDCPVEHELDEHILGNHEYLSFPNSKFWLLDWLLDHLPAVFQFFIEQSIIGFVFEINYPNCAKEWWLFELKHMTGVYIISFKGFPLILPVKEMNQAQVIPKNDVSSSTGTTGDCHILKQQINHTDFWKTLQESFHNTVV